MGSVHSSQSKRWVRGLSVVPGEGLGMLRNRVCCGAVL